MHLIGVALDPDVIFGRVGTACVAGVDHSARLHKQDAALPGCNGSMLDTSGDDIHFAGGEWYRPVLELECHLAIKNNEELEHKVNYLLAAAIEARTK